VQLWNSFARRTREQRAGSYSTAARGRKHVREGKSLKARQIRLGQELELAIDPPEPRPLESRWQDERRCPEVPLPELRHANRRETIHDIVDDDELRFERAAP
jgi:hypothetical protein